MSTDLNTILAEDHTVLEVEAFIQFCQTRTWCYLFSKFFLVTFLSPQLWKQCTVVIMMASCILDLSAATYYSYYDPLDCDAQWKSSALYTLLGLGKVNCSLPISWNIITGSVGKLLLFFLNFSDGTATRCHFHSSMWAAGARRVLHNLWPMEGSVGTFLFCFTFANEIYSVAHFSVGQLATGSKQLIFLGLGPQTQAFLQSHHNNQ